MIPARERSGLPVQEIQTCFGLIADTHYPDRLPSFPAVINEIFDGVDLILHAGDVGELRTLDALSETAPVIAVHGNDDTEEAQRTLPAQQLIPLKAQRILLFHSHNADRAEELAARKIDDWGPKLTVRAERVRAAGAVLGVSGHTHVPLDVTHDGIRLINPGAVSQGNDRLRQTLCSVAILTVSQADDVMVNYINLEEPQASFQPQVDLDAGFSAAHNQVSQSIWDDDLSRFWEPLVALVRLDEAAMRMVLRRSAYPVWRGEREQVTRADLRRAAQDEPTLPPAVRQLIEKLLE
ncbi:MAG: metallophosphoesterase family protein [Chloroflexi bacterium]|nr:metallophosphoesterase family protein [Chloroflexota bacterium]